MLMDFSKENFDIIIQAGQSNAEGNGFGDVESPWVEDERVWYMMGPHNRNEFYFTPATEGVRDNETKSNFNLSFARKYLETGFLKEGRKLLILCAAVGGTGFLNGEWKPTDIYYIRMMEMIRTAVSLNNKNRIVGFLWHQGEADGRPDVTFDIHYNHLYALLKSVREEFNIPHLPFIAGDFVHEWRDKHMDVCKPVLDAIRAVCKDCGYGRFVETDGLDSNFRKLGYPVNCFGNMINDEIHFSREALYELGERYFSAYCDILNERL